VCLANESSGRARRRRSGARRWLDQEPVRLAGVTHHRPATRFPCIRPASSRPCESSRRIDRDACRRGGLRDRMSTRTAISTRLRSLSLPRERCWRRRWFALANAVTRRRFAWRRGTRAVFALGQSRVPAITAPGSLAISPIAARKCSRWVATSAPSGDCAARMTRFTDPGCTYRARGRDAEAATRGTAPGGAAGATAFAAQRRRRPSGVVRGFLCIRLVRPPGS